MRPILITPDKPFAKNYTHYSTNTFEDSIVGYNLDGSAKQFDGFTFLMQIKVNASDDTFVIEIPDASFTITQNQDGIDAGVNNVVEINHTATDFPITAVGCYVYDITMTETASGDVQTIQIGTFEIVENVSR